jgi:hypothetical protein
MTTVHMHDDPLPRVLLSVTTTPSRAHVTLPKTLVSLQQQTYPGIVGIVLTVPRVNARGIPGHADLSFLGPAHQTPRPLFLHQPNHDFGPVMKYVGVDEVFPATQDDDNGSLGGKDGDVRNLYVMVVDDDNVYSPNRVQDLVRQLLQTPRNQRHRTGVGLPTRNGLHWLHGSFFWPMGFAGVLVPMQAVRVIAKETRQQWPLPRPALLNDDVLVGVFMYNHGFQFKADKSPITCISLTGNPNALNVESGIMKGLDMMTCRRLMASKQARVMGDIAVTISVLVLVLFVVIIIVVVMCTLPATTNKQKGGN